MITKDGTIIINEWDTAISPPPATITLASITYQSKSLPVCRIDN